MLIKWVRSQLEKEEPLGEDLFGLDTDDDDDGVALCPTPVGGIDALACIMAFRKLYNHPSLLLQALRSQVLSSSKKVCHLLLN